MLFVIVFLHVCICSGIAGRGGSLPWAAHLWDGIF